MNCFGGGKVAGEPISGKKVGGETVFGEITIAMRTKPIVWVSFIWDTLLLISSIFNYTNALKDFSFFQHKSNSPFTMLYCRLEKLPQVFQRKRGE